MKKQKNNIFLPQGVELLLCVYPEPLLWLDASDINSLVFNESDKVIELKDKSNNANHATNENSSFIESTINGRRAINFNNGSKLSTLNFNNINFANNEASMFYVFDIPDAVTDNSGVFGNNESLISNDHYDFHTHGIVWTHHFRKDRLAGFSPSNTTKGMRLVSIIANENTGLYEYRINGKVEYTSSELNWQFENNINKLGYARNARLQSGNFGESIIINETANIHTEKIEGYLAHKWGIQLPDDHNYRYIYPEWCGAGNVPSPTPSPSPTITTSPTVTPSPTETPSPTVTPSPTITPLDCCEEDMLTHDLVASTISSFGEPTITATGVTQNATICIGTPSGELPYTLKLIFNGELVAILTTTGTFNNNKVYYNTEDGKCYQGIIEDDVCLLGYEPACVDFNLGSLSTQRSYNRIIFNEPTTGYITSSTG